jgi:hypothetical protein
MAGWPEPVSAPPSAGIGEARMSDAAEKLSQAMQALERGQRDIRLGDHREGRLNLRAAQAIIVETLVLLAKERVS